MKTNKKSSKKRKSVGALVLLANKKQIFLGFLLLAIILLLGATLWRTLNNNDADAISIPAPSFYKDYYGTCTGTTHTLRANAAGASMAIWALTPTGWIKVASKNGVIAGTTLSVSRSKIASLGGSGRTGLRGFVTTSTGITSPYDFCYSHWGG